MATVYTPPKNDAYTVLLSISLGALVLGCILLFMDWSEYSPKKPPTPPAPSVQTAQPAEQAAPPAPVTPPEGK